MSITVFARTSVLALSLGLGGLALSACGSPSASSSPTSSPADTTSSAPAATPSASPIAATTVAAPAVTAPELRAAALTAWKEGAVVSSAETDRYLAQAAADLAAATSHGASDAASYTTAITRLEQLEAVPETNVTAAQKATVSTDTEALNSFFGTPGRYGFPAS